jgi:hypothetical protein
MPAATTVEPFRPSSGQGVGWTGLVLLCGGAVWAVAADPGLPSLRVGLGMLLAATVVWVAMLRPRAAVRHDEGLLVLRNPLSDTYVPLSRIDQVSVRQTLDVLVGDERYVCIGIGRSARETMRRRRQTLTELESPTGHSAPAAGEAYGDFVARRISTLAHEARSSARRRTDDPALHPPAVRREWALPEAALLAVLTLAFLATLAG